ncbi:HAD-IIIC family phosphatase [Paenibacillus gansuensis]|uniref:HAD-IIIC family phosphatase n=1 Tax=Paenibacillus gansuensis TaxID=306542 RepID=A0ABW5PHS9_9BACL
MIKCVIWDLDNTVWNGILSEDIEVTLRSGIVDILESFKQKGVVQTIASRNDMEVAKGKLKEMGIDKYFLYPQINWGNKVNSIQKFINGFHFKIEDILFVDDNEFERDQVRSKFSTINISDAKNLTEVFEIAKNLKRLDTTEAIERLELYALEEKRLINKENFSGTDIDFLRDSNIQIELLMANYEELDRIKELIDRTNQLNTTGYRYTKDQLKEMIDNPSYKLYIFKVSDKYGTYGRAALLILRVHLEKRVDIVQLIVSCRLLGRGVAQSLLYLAYLHALSINSTLLTCMFKRNQFNRQMILMFTSNKFKNEDFEKTEEANFFELDITCNKIYLPNWINFLNSENKEINKVLESIKK